MTPAAPDHAGLLDEFSAYDAAVLGSAPNTVRNHRIYLSAFLRWWVCRRPGGALAGATAADVSAFLVAEAERGMSARTRRAELAAVRRLFAWLLLRGLCGDNPATLVPSPKAAPLHTDIYPPGQVREILAHTATLTDVRGRQRHAIVATLRYSGMRSGELRTLRHRDLDLAAGRAVVVGKGARQRIVLLPPALVPTLTEFLNEVRPLLPDSPLLLANAHPFVTTPQHGFGTDALAREVELAGLGAGRARPALPAQVAAHLRHRAGPRRRGHPRGAAAARARPHRLHRRLPAPRAGRPALRGLGPLGRRMNPDAALGTVRMSPHSEDPHTSAHQMVLNSMRRWRMRTTVTLDDDLLAEVEALTGRRERSALLRLALEALLERESARRLALLGGTDPAAEAAARHRAGLSHAAGRHLGLDRPPARGGAGADRGAARRRRCTSTRWCSGSSRSAPSPTGPGSCGCSATCRSPRVASHAEVLHLVESRRLYGRGLALVDAHLLAATLLTPGVRLWTRDRALHAAADGSRYPSSPRPDRPSALALGQAARGAGQARPATTAREKPEAPALRRGPGLRLVQCYRGSGVIRQPGYPCHRW